MSVHNSLASAKPLGISCRGLTVLNFFDVLHKLLYNN